MNRAKDKKATRTKRSKQSIFYANLKTQNIYNERKIRIGEQTNNEEYYLMISDFLLPITVIKLTAMFNQSTSVNTPVELNEI